MKITSESVSNIETKLTVELPSDKLKSKVESELKKVQKRAKIDGFRPGKVPMSRIRSQYGQGVQQDVINDVIRESVFEAIEKEGIKAIGAPDIEDVKLENDTLSYTAKVEIYPQVEVSGLDKIEVTRLSADVSDEEVETMIENLRAQRQTFSEADKAVEDKDQVTFDFAGTLDGEAFEGGTSKDFKLVIGSGRMIPGFEDGILGMKTGETKTIDVTFPEDYQAENLKGKEAQFEITVNKIEEPKLPEIDEEFLKQFNVTEGGVDQLKADVRKNMEREVKNATRALTKRRAFDALIEQNEIEVPKTLLGHEIERQREMMMQRFMQQFGGQNSGQINKDMLPDELFTEQAKKAANLSVVLASLIESKEIKVDEARVTEFVNEMAENYEDPSEVVEYYTNDPQQKAQIEGVVLEDQLVDEILSQGTITEEKVSYQELLAEAQKNAQ